MFPLSEKIKSRTVLLCGRSVPELGKKVSTILDLPLAHYQTREFENGELLPEVKDSVRGKHVYLIQSVCPPDVNGYLVELYLTVCMLRRASAKTVTAIIPHYGYARQDRKYLGHVPISAADVAKMLETAGVDRVVSFDLHCGQIQGFFPPHIPCDNIPAANIAVDYFAQLINGHPRAKRGVVIISPDAGGTTRAKTFMELLRKHTEIDITFAMISKERSNPGVVSSMTLVGSVDSRICIIVDDMIDTAGTLVSAANMLVETEGVHEVYAFATHGIFSGDAIQKIETSRLSQVVVCDTVPTPPFPKLKCLSVGPILSSVISCIANCKSVSHILKQ